LGVRESLAEKLCALWLADREGEWSSLTLGSLERSAALLPRVLRLGDGPERVSPARFLSRASASPYAASWAASEALVPPGPSEAKGASWFKMACACSAALR
jgi:hypothetical protein